MKRPGSTPASFGGATAQILKVGTEQEGRVEEGFFSLLSLRDNRNSMLCSTFVLGSIRETHPS